MRLTKKEHDALRYSLQWFDGDVFLFGSRVDVHKKWWDIDVCLVSSDVTQAFRISVDVATKFRSKVDQKIDVVVLPRHQKTTAQEAFFSSINKVPLCLR